MYQFYYADTTQKYIRGVCRDDVRNHFVITAVRPTMWEEHCLECSAPLCYKNCVHYVARSDGRCKRFANGFYTFEDARACCGQGAHIKFRKWANMMTIIYPAMMSEIEYLALYKKNQELGNKLKKVADSRLPSKVRWEVIRTEEYLRRRGLRASAQAAQAPDAFVFHGYSYEEKPFNLILEIYDDHTPLFRTAIFIEQGENLLIVDKKQLSPECWKANNLVKVYPENDLEAELDILWCDFVQGKEIVAERPAEKVKCVVWDLDNTLWDGTLIETEEPEQLRLKRGVPEIIAELDRRGIIQSIASKNDMNQAWPIVEKMGLAEYFLYPQIHWNAKSGSLVRIAKSLNIGIDTFALIDDSHFEREQVRSACPQVRVYDVLELPQLLDKPEFQVLVTAESGNRRTMYRAEEKRNQLKEIGQEDTVTFLKKCNLQTELFTPKTEEEVQRCFELIVRTNQLNMSGRKYTREEFENILKRQGCKSFAFSCRDDFGGYGIVGFGQYKVDGSMLVFTEFAMSCRVAGKFVESALFSFLLNLERCQYGKFDVCKTTKNSLLRRTLNEIGFSVKTDKNNHIEYEYSVPLIHDDLVQCEKREGD